MRASAPAHLQRARLGWLLAAVTVQLARAHRTLLPRRARVKVVTDFGGSRLGSAPAVFAVGAPYVKGLAQTSSSEYTGDIVEGTYAGDVLESVKYEEAKIVAFDDGRLIISRARGETVLQRVSGPTAGDAGTAPGDGSAPGTPPPGPLPVCDGTEDGRQVKGRATITLSGAPLNNGTYKDVEALSGPHQTSVGCVYRFSAYPFGADAGGNLPSVIVDFKRRPIANRTYTSPSGIEVYCSGVTPNGSSWEGGTGGSVAVEVVGQSITLTLKDIVCSDSYRRDLKPVFNGTIGGG